MFYERLFSQFIGIDISSHVHTAAVIVITIYVLIVRGLRYRRMDDLQRPFTVEGRPLASMTNAESHEIFEQLQRLEFPRAFLKARQMAQLKVSAIAFNFSPGFRATQSIRTLTSTR